MALPCTAVNYFWEHKGLFVNIKFAPFLFFHSDAENYTNYISYSRNWEEVYTF